MKNSLVHIISTSFNVTRWWRLFVRKKNETCQNWTSHTIHNCSPHINDCSSCITKSVNDSLTQKYAHKTVKQAVNFHYVDAWKLKKIWMAVKALSLSIDSEMWRWPYVKSTNKLNKLHPLCQQPNICHSHIFCLWCTYLILHLHMLFAFSPPTSIFCNKTIVKNFLNINFCDTLLQISGLFINSTKHRVCFMQLTARTYTYKSLLFTHSLSKTFTSGDQ